MIEERDRSIQGFHRELCRALGLEGKRVRRLNLSAEAGRWPVLTLERSVGIDELGELIVRLERCELRPVHGQSPEG